MRRRFSETAYQARLAEFSGCCTDCGIRTGGPAGLEWDHIIPLKMDGEDEIAKLQPLCRGCHRAKTRRDARHIAKAKRMQRRASGISPTRKHKIPGSRGTGWRRPLNGPAYRVEE